MKYGLDKWTMTPAPRDRAALRLLCFHHAGGGAYGYRPWVGRLRADVELVAVQLPGRENRREEPLLHDADAVLDGLVRALEGALPGPYAVFGHSLGATLAHRLACRVRRTGELAAPVRLFLSAARPPRLAAPDEPAFEPLSESDAIAQLKRFGGTPAAVLEDPDLLRAFLPALLADYEILGRLRRSDEPPLDIPFTLIKGDEDPTLKWRHLAEWRGLSSAPAATHVLPGGHFYPPSSQTALLDILNAELGNYI
jgi:surfactin synthase thioesterase subunit